MDAIKDVIRHVTTLAEEFAKVVRHVRDHEDRLQTLERRVQALADATDAMESDWGSVIDGMKRDLERIKG